MTFGDADPEDAWDASDPVPVKVANLARRIALLDGGRIPRGTERIVLAIIARRLADWHRARTGPVAPDWRAALIAQDLARLRELVE